MVSFNKTDFDLNVDLVRRNSMPVWTCVAVCLRSQQSSLCLSLSSQPTYCLNCRQRNAERIEVECTLQVTKNAFRILPMGMSRIVTGKLGKDDNVGPSQSFPRESASDLISMSNNEASLFFLKLSLPPWVMRPKITQNNINGTVTARWRIVSIHCIFLTLKMSTYSKIVTSGAIMRRGK